MTTGLIAVMAADVDSCVALVQTRTKSNGFVEEDADEEPCTSLTLAGNKRSQTDPHSAEYQPHLGTALSLLSRYS